MSVISFDLSMSNVGYSIFSDDGLFFMTGSIETNGKDSTPKRLKHIAKEMKKLKKENPKTIVIERGFYRFAGSTQQIFRVHGITNLIFADIEQIEIHATSVRKTVFGHGNMKKEQVEEYVKQSYPDFKYNNLDEMDSFVLGLAYFKQKGIINGAENF